MFCENCGTDNVAGAKFCAACGATLASGEPESNGYYQESYQDTYQPEPYQQDNYQPSTYQQQDVYPQSQGYYQPQRAVRVPQAGRSTGAIVLYMIAGAIALLSILMVFLPQVSVWGETANVFRIITSTTIFLGFLNSSQANAFGIIFLAFFIIPMILQFVWAILSFVRVRAAGVLGLIGSIIDINVTIFWFIILKAGFGNNVTAVPAFMMVLAIAGMVLSIIQLTKKNRVR